MFLKYQIKKPTLIKKLQDHSSKKEIFNNKKLNFDAKARVKISHEFQNHK